MSAEEDAKRVMRIYRMRQKKRGPMAEAGRRLGMRPKIVADWNRSKRGMRTLDVLQTHEAMEVRLPAEVYHEALFSLDTDPAAILEYAREFQKLPMDPFLARIKPRLEALAAAGPSNDGAPWPSREEEIRRLDLLRRRERDPAKKLLEQLISAELELMEQGPRPRRAFGELCGELGVLAAIYRLAGRRDDAVDLLILARPLVVWAEDFLVDGHWYRKAAYLLVDLNRCLRASEFVLEAQDKFTLAGAEFERVRTLVDRAYVFFHAGKHRDSVARLERALTQLPVADAEYRAAAYQILALNALALGDLQTGGSHLDVAIQLAGDDLLTKAYCLSCRAELLVRMGASDAGLANYREALQIYAKLAGAAELAEVAMDYAGVLRKEGRRPELRLLAADLSGWLEELKGTLKLRDAIADFQALIQQDKLHDAAFMEIRRRVDAVKMRGVKR